MGEGDAETAATAADAATVAPLDVALARGNWPPLAKRCGDAHPLVVRPFGDAMGRAEFGRAAVAELGVGNCSCGGDGGVLPLCACPVAERRWMRMRGMRDEPAPEAGEMTGEAMAAVAADATAAAMVPLYEAVEASAPCSGLCDAEDQARVRGESSGLPCPGVADETPVVSSGDSCGKKVPEVD